VTTIAPAVAVAVLAAGLLHALWNAMAKSFTDQRASFALLNVGVVVPSVIAVAILGTPRAAAWPYLAAAVGCHLGYELALMAAYRHGTLSKSYPIARGVAPLLTTLGGLVFAHEHVGGRSLGGVFLVVAGIASLALIDRAATSRRGVLFALLTGVAIATYTVVDGLGVRASHAPLTYAAWLFALQSVLFIAGIIVHDRTLFCQGTRKVAVGIAAGLVSLVAYTIVLWAQDHAPLGVVSALRETGVLWAAGMGVWWFKERGGWRLATSAGVVLAGVVLIAMN
jgi:drug/metabolite transporter (DMT)-like permease